MRILITGGAGFIGANLTRKLKKEDPSDLLTVLDDFSSGAKENLADFEGELIQGNVQDRKLMQSLKGKNFDCIFHEAAITDTTFPDEERMMSVNVQGFKNILELAGCRDAPLVYASSAGVYGNGPFPMKENQRLLPLNSYSLSKKKMDEIALSIQKPESIGLRYFNVYGRGESHKGKSASMISQLAKKMKEGIRPRIFKYGEQKRDFIYVEDVLTATIKAMEVLHRGKVKKNIVLNVGTGTATTFNRIIDILNNLLGTNFEPEYFDNPYDFYQNHTQADTSLAEEILGFKAEYSIEDGIRSLLKTDSVSS